MRDLGTPVYSAGFFREVLRELPEHSRILCASIGGVPVAASLVVWRGNRMEVPWASSLREFNPSCANVLLYWHMLRLAIAGRCTAFDFGRSTPNEGTFHFKQQWGAQPHPLFWEYWLANDRPLPDRGPTNPRFSVARAAWSRLPVPLTRLLGPSIVRNIP
jgi:FemAB-related protein (PEP-CTERM system-associated)